MSGGDDNLLSLKTSPSEIPPKESLRILILDHIRKNTPVQFPQLVKDLNLKRTTAHDAVRDLEFSRLIISHFRVNDSGQSVKWLKVREDGK